MKTFQLLLALAILVGSTTTTVAQSPGTLYRGEVWTWDERDSTVMLRDGARMLRVQIPLDDVRRLKMHEITTVRGQLLGPKPIEQVIVPGPALAAVPRGAIARSETTGRVVALDSSGLMTVDTSQGRVTIWTNNPSVVPVAPGSVIRLRSTVQGADIVPQASLVGADAQQPAASVMTEPGDYAVVTGRVVSVDPRGLLTVESPRGPITVWLQEVTLYQLGAAVQVGTFVRGE